MWVICAKPPKHDIRGVRTKAERPVAQPLLLPLSFVVLGFLTCTWGIKMLTVQLIEVLLRKAKPSRVKASAQGGSAEIVTISLTNLRLRVGGHGVIWSRPPSRLFSSRPVILSSPALLHASVSKGPHTGWSQGSHSTLLYSISLGILLEVGRGPER